MHTPTKRSEESVPSSVSRRKIGALERISSALRSFNDLPDDAEVRVGVVAALKGVSEVTVWRWSRQGLLPKPRRRGGVTTWNVGELRKA